MIRRWKWLGLTVALFGACAHPLPASRCLSTPPPTLEDHKLDCTNWNPKDPNETGPALNCALWRLNRYLAESSMWMNTAWVICAK